MYEQALYKILKDHIKPKILKRMNRYKKWEYGYNKEHDIVVISKITNISNGDIVVALIDQEEATLKKFRKKGDSIALEPANKHYKTQIY